MGGKKVVVVCLETPLGQRHVRRGLGEGAARGCGCLALEGEQLHVMLRNGSHVQGWVDGKGWHDSRPAADEATLCLRWRRGSLSFVRVA